LHNLNDISANWLWNYRLCIFMFDDIWIMKKKILGRQLWLKVLNIIWYPVCRLSSSECKGWSLSVISCYHSAIWCPWIVIDHKRPLKETLPPIHSLRDKMDKTPAIHLRLSNWEACGIILWHQCLSGEFIPLSSRTLWIEVLWCRSLLMKHRGPRWKASTREYVQPSCDQETIEVSQIIETYWVITTINLEAHLEVMISPTPRRCILRIPTGFAKPGRSGGESNDETHSCPPVRTIILYNQIQSG
jgi:hypothetical protein